MARLLQQLGIVELEDLFVKSKGELQALRDLEYELRHRQVRRAGSLLVKVRSAMKATDTITPSAAPESAVADHPPAMSAQPELRLFNPVRLAPPHIKPLAPIGSKQPNPSREKKPLIPLSEAYRLLKANPGSSWESLELVRQQLVQKASPAVASTDQQLRLQEDANRINEAYKAIVAARLQGS